MDLGTRPTDSTEACSLPRQAFKAPARGSFPAAVNAQMFEISNESPLFLVVYFIVSSSRLPAIMKERNDFAII